VTFEQKQHLAALQREVVQRLGQKYRRGQKEHGGNLWKKPGIIDMAIEEAIDLIVYLLTLKAQLSDPAMIDPKAHDVCQSFPKRSKK